MDEVARGGTFSFERDARRGGGLQPLAQSELQREYEELIEDQALARGVETIGVGWTVYHLDRFLQGKQRLAFHHRGRIPVAQPRQMFLQHRMNQLSKAAVTVEPDFL